LDAGATTPPEGLDAPRPPAWRRRAERIGRALLVLAIAWTAWGTFASLADLLRDRSPARAVEPEGAGLALASAALAAEAEADGAWTLEGSGWSASSERLDAAAVADRLRRFDEEAGVREPGPREARRVHRFDGGRLRLRIETEDAPTPRLLRAAIARAEDPGGEAWTLWRLAASKDAGPAAGAEGGGLLPLPPGARRLASRRAKGGATSLEVVATPGGLDADAYWARAGWERSGPEEAGRLYRKGDRRVFAWSPPDVGGADAAARVWFLLAAPASPRGHATSTGKEIVGES